MNIYEFDIQMFAAGDVVNYSGNGVDANAGTYNTNANTPVSSGDLSAEMKTFYDKALLTLAEPNLVHDQFGQKRPIPKGGGKTIEFRRFSKLPKALTPITEGVTPAGNKLRVTAMTAQVNQFGDYIEQTDLLELTAIDNTIVEATKELGSQAGLTLDTIVRNEINAGTNVMYAMKDINGVKTVVNSRKDITGDCRLTVKDVFKAAAELKAVNAPKINGAYVAIIHPFVAFDLMQSAGQQWVDIHKYKDPETIYRGEIGMIGGVRFVESTEAAIFGPGKISGEVSRTTVKNTLASPDKSLVVDGEMETATGLNISVYVNGTANTVTAITKGSGMSTLTLQNDVTVADGTAGNLVCGAGGGKDGSAVFSTIFLGENAYGVTEITGGGLEHIVKQKGYGNDPLNQRSSIGWKALKTARILLDEYLIRYESGSEFSATAESN